MASTKEMQRRAKANKAKANKANNNKTQKIGINSREVTRLLMNLSAVILRDIPNHCYTQTPDSKYVAVSVVNKFNLGKHYEDLLKYREVFDEAIEKKYGAKMPSGMGAIMSDPEAILNKHNVPRELRVASGLLDSIVSQAAMACGAVQFHTVRM